MNLQNLAGGALQERFELELNKVLENIQDLNTEAKKPREITIKVKIKPNEERNIADVTIEATSKLMPYAAIPTTIIMDKDEQGKAVANELKSGIPGQSYFDTEDEKFKDDTGNVIEFETKNRMIK